MATERAGFEHRYEMWLEQLQQYASKHGITLDQAISILWDGTSQGNLLNWVEVNEFYMRYWGAKHGK